VFKRAVKPQFKIRLAFSGIAGSGKTFSALSIASHLGQLMLSKQQKQLVMM
jgi:predicted ribonuclease YlaK